ncbi:Peptidase C12, ubiquitin carboxyl-terminal hydrolase 1 [Penicillium griseofulvum]|uniref:Ubiquitin carboxyl-terminal hydrolase n=1 Tax=Penicillium patulum TaxID=5078 RepID=A0A135LRU0_PENPA|nr:Peptidase C12, ubiquitin carboxyl-terminal hydrolase 1 [Penicillium griseofulvum]KXG51680.1 Peptidase C12, ubiquitin carboxyl-terminal hydrolase 1 [Penicillium griseofulvum]
MFNLGVQVINGQKTFIPLENNPEVHTHLCKNLGVSPSLTFHDILSTTPEMLSRIPRPVNALILLCDKPIYLAVRSGVEHSIPEYLGSGADEPVLWMKQTIGHACGLMALLHVVVNLENGKYVTAGSELEKIVKLAVELGPVERARLFNNTMTTILITGAIGKQGGSVIENLPERKKKKKAPFKILAVTRNPDSTAAKKFAQKSSNITLIQGNLEDPAAIFKNVKYQTSTRVWAIFSVQTANPKNANDDERRQEIDLIDESIKQGVKYFEYSSVDRGGERLD